METSAAFPLDGSLLCLAVVLKVETKMFFSLLFLLFTLSIYKKGEEYKRKHGNDPAGDPTKDHHRHTFLFVLYTVEEKKIM